MAGASYDAIVVGAGFGGSACAGLLARRGLRVLLVEKNARAGGKAMSLSKNGFTYTAWPVMGAPLIGNLYAIAAKEMGVDDLITLIAPPPSASTYRTASGRYVRMPAMPPGEMDPSLVFDWLEVRPADRDSALGFFATLTMMPPEEVATLYGTSFQEWIGRFTVPRSLYAFLVSSCCDGMFMVPVDLLDAGEAVKSLQDMFLRHGPMFCQGGFGRVAEAYCEAVRRSGGKVMMNAKTERITVEGGRVTGVVTSQETFRAPIVISNAGVQPTVLRLVGAHQFPLEYVKQVKSLVPSWALLGYRYFLRRTVTDAPTGVIFSDTSPWTLDRLNQAHAGEASREGVVYFEVPSNYDPTAAPAGKQIIMTGSFCPPSPQMTNEEVMAWAGAGEAIMFTVFPELKEAIEDKELYTPKDVSNLTRESVVRGVGGETIGVGQVVGQCGANKPAIAAPLRGLFFVGCDAGGTGVGTQQAIESGMRVADAVLAQHRAAQAAA